MTSASPKRIGCAAFWTCKTAFLPTILPELLRALELRGCIVTIDAMGRQKAIATEICNADADYVLALKGNLCG